MAKKPLPYRGFIVAGYTVLTGPNKLNPELLDAVILFTDLGLMAIHPEIGIVLAAVTGIINELPPHALTDNTF